MLRRSFRIGLLTGLLGGAIAAVFKAVQARSPSRPAPAAPWTPIPNAEPVFVPPRPAPVRAEPVIVPPRPAPARAEPVVVPPRPAPVRAEPVVVPPVPVEALQEPIAPPPRAEVPEKAPVAPKKTAVKKAPAKKKLAPWVEPVGSECPATHPVKGKMSSKIFHLPGGFNYARTTPDRCYVDAAAAEADGLRQAKR